MSDAKNCEVQWYEHLMLACVYEGNSIQDEHEHFRQEAAAAPLDELELFLSSPEGRHEANARAVMAQVYEARASKRKEEKAKEEARLQWWRGLVQQISAQLIGALTIGIIVGFISGVWFCAL
ncbi:hypothetical protein HNQ57_002593 [Zhongshania antarctica]|uniref:Uncharacterized protein n=1 Tax=Zhongshania antarctica TaxID=641702 RepID=A0A840R6T3_9GAMM|nr:hypothetical protein [Zhongshania antarctica]MBB5188314.1 hypothetical protein [Zhongshania antarctica]